MYFTKHKNTEETTMKMNLPKDVNFIIDRLYENGFEGYAVGGCVRDTILGREPQDWDITTSAKPEEVKRLFRRTIDTGIQHGTVTVMIGKLETNLRDYAGDYGILPMPKYDSVQKDYRTCVQDQVSAFMLPATLPESKKEMMGAVLECLASESYKTVADAYYNTALSYRYLNNPESKVMLDLIYDSVSFEIAQIYTDCIGSFLNDMRAIVSSKNNTTVSKFKQIRRSMEKAVKDVNKSYEKITEKQ